MQQYQNFKHEDKKEHNTNTKRKTEGNLEKELEKMINDIQKIKKGHCEQKKKNNWKQMTTQKTSKKRKQKKEKTREVKIKYRKRVELKKI